LRLGPAGEEFGHRIEQCHPGAGIGGDDGIANGFQRDSQLLLAVTQRDIVLL
jgi:hypothetical protein